MAWKSFRVVEGASRPGPVYSVRIPAGAAVGDFCKVLAARKHLFSVGIDASALIVFANSKAMEEGRSLRARVSLNDYGGDANDPLIVKEPKVWFQLTKPDGRTPFNDTTAASVLLVEENTVEDLRDAIRKKYQDNLLVGIAASALKVYSDDNPEPLRSSAQIKSRGQTLKKALVVAVPMPKRTRARDGSTDKVGECPAKRHRHDDIVESEWKWKEEEERVYAVKNGCLFYVEREHATQQLQEFHQHNYSRAVLGHDQDWIIPLVDNVWGFGKTMFGSEYIRSCQKRWETDPDKAEDSCLDTLRKCHTINIELFWKNLVVGKELRIDGGKARKAFVDRICWEFKDRYDRLPRALTPQSLQEYSSHVVVLSRLTQEVGPLFIVLDRINRAFDCDGLGDDMKREQFLELCDQVLVPLFSIRNLCFFVSGRASFLSSISSAARYRVGRSLLFKRLSFNLFRPPTIEEILKRTYWDGQKVETIQEHYGLDEDKVKEVADRLFKTTFGLPRELLAAFGECASYGELLDYEALNQPWDGLDWQAFGKRLLKFGSPLRSMINCVIKGEEIDLSIQWQDEEGKVVTYDVITVMVGIVWEGKVTSAKLRVPQHVQYAILSSFYSFRELVVEVVPALSKGLIVDPIDPFELLCMKRFLDLFHEEIRPSNALTGYFIETQKFGRCTGVKFAKNSGYMPKILLKAKRSRSWYSVITDEYGLRELMKEMDGFVLKGDQLSLKPLAGSSSPEIILMTPLPSGATLMVGLLVRNGIKCGEVSETALRTECEKFSRMCTQLPTSSQPRLNVLIVCATAYNDELRAKFDPNFKSAVFSIETLPEKARAGIDEVILLDLCTPENRDEFFGLADEVELKKTLEGGFAKPR